MAFISGPVSFQRLFVAGELPAAVDDKFMEQLTQRGFARSAARSDDLQVGWIGPRHVLDTELDARHLAWGRFAHFAVRLDRLRIPSNILKAYVRIEEEAALEAGGREFLSKGERRRARDAALERAELEARAGAFRRTTAYPLLLDLERRVLYVGGTSASLADHVMQLFRDTFGYVLEPSDPERLAFRQLLARKRERHLEKLEALHLVSPPKDYGESAALDVPGDLSFLGREFLSWLWYRTDTADEALRLTGGDDVTVMLDKTLRLTCDFGLTGTDTLTADSPAELPEAQAALRIGKQPVKAGLILGSATGEYRLTLDGVRMTVSSLVLPEDEGERDARARIELRFEHVAESAALLDALFDLFLQARTGRGWVDEATAMCAWAGGTSPAKRPRSVSA